MSFEARTHDQISQASYGQVAIDGSSGQTNSQIITPDVPESREVLPESSRSSLTRSSAGFAVPDLAKSDVLSGSTGEESVSSSDTDSLKVDTAKNPAGFAVPVASEVGRPANADMATQGVTQSGEFVHKSQLTPESSSVVQGSVSLTSQQIPAAPPAPSSGATHTSGLTSRNKAGVFRDGAGRLIWQCSTCGATNDIDVIACTVCGSSMFAEYIKEEEEKKKPRVTPGVAGLWGVIPGGGQWVVGRRGEGIWRAVLTFWLLGCAIVLNPRSIAWVRMIFFLLSLSVWGISIFDARIQAGGKGKEILNSKRMLLILVASVALLLSLSFVLAGEVRNFDQSRPRGPEREIESPRVDNPGSNGGGGSSNDAPT